MNKTKIPYGDYHWAPVEGCLRGCSYCWAQRVLKRIGGVIGCDLCVRGVPHVHRERWDQPTPRQKPAIVLTIFRGDAWGPWLWRDPSDDTTVNSALIGRLIAHRAARCLQHKFVMLTRYPENIPDINWPNNTYHGVTITNQAEADDLIPKLLASGVPHPWVSIEPMLGPVDLSAVEWPSCSFRPPRGIAGVIVGGQSGPHAAPMHPDWVRSVRDQCGETGTPFMFKQWGAWEEGEPYYTGNDVLRDHDLDQPHVLVTHDGSWPHEGEAIQPPPETQIMVRNTGRGWPLLDGRTHFDLAWR